MPRVREQPPVFDVGVGVDNERVRLQRLARTLIEADDSAAIAGIGGMRNPLLLTRTADVGGGRIDEHVHPVCTSVEAALPREDERVALGLLYLRPARCGGATADVAERERLRGRKRCPVQHDGVNADGVRAYSEKVIRNDKRFAGARATIIL